jgi:hypothetical protein
MLADFTQLDLGTIAVRAALERAFGLSLPPERTPGEFDYAPLGGTASSVIVANGNGRFMSSGGH